MAGEKKERNKFRVAETVEVGGDVGALPVVWGSAWGLGAEALAFVAESAALLRPRALWIVDGSEEEGRRLRDQLVAQGLLRPLPKRPTTFLCRTHPADVVRFEDRTWIVAPDQLDVEADLHEPPPDKADFCPSVSKSNSNQHPTPELNPKSTPEKLHPVSLSQNSQNSEERELLKPALAQWMSPKMATEEVLSRFPGAMRGRTMFVVPFCMGPPGGRFSLTGVELTDSAYVVLCMRLLSHVGPHCAPKSTNFFRCVHSLGVPLPATQRYITGWECNTESAIILHYPNERRVWSFGSGFGGNSLLAKKCVALRLASWLGREENWFAAHMAVFSVTREADGVRRYFGAAFPTGCGKTQLAFMKPSKPGFTIRVLGDDIAWLRWDPKSGRLCATCPENGFFGIASSVSAKNNPIILDMLKSNAIITNVAETAEGDFFWEGLEEIYAKTSAYLHGTDWRGHQRLLKLRDLRAIGGALMAHPNSRFAVAYSQCPEKMRHEALPPNSYGVPLDAIIFGSRRCEKFPLVYEASHYILQPKGNVITSGVCSPWIRGAYIGASLRSQPAFASSSDPASKKPQPEPFAMRPFIPYNLGRFAKDWLRLGQQPVVEEDVKAVLPRVYHVNWFRDDDKTGELLWPGYGENIRVLEWMMRRLDEGPTRNGVPTETGEASLLGIVPRPGKLDIEGLNVNWEALMEQTWSELGVEAAEVASFFQQQGGSEFPISLIVCGFHHLSVPMDPRHSLFRRGWEHLKPESSDCLLRSSGSEVDLFDEFPDDLKPASSATSTSYVPQSPRQSKSS